MRLSKWIVAAGLVLAYAGTVLGAVSADEAKKLGTTLTAVGAEKSGNADGSIPPYTGGLTTPPANFKTGSGIRPDPFANEKPLFSVSAKNMSQYTNKLTEGVKALMKKYPTYRIDVFKTHRTVSMPQYVLDNTLQNATHAQTSNNGLAVKNAKGGVPFPIPKDGYEAMWNHLLRYSGESTTHKYKNFNIDASGRSVMSCEATLVENYPYYNRKGKSSDFYYMLKNSYIGPARRSGEIVMVKFPINMAEQSTSAWQYLPGQRRVKMAPELLFDTPNTANNGMTTYDDNFMFNGSMERYNFKLIEKREMLVPYNAYKMTYQVKSDELFHPKHANPDHVRWELHRVWVVEGTLKQGQRHIYSKRVYYIDEDSWAALASDEYDMRGNLYRVQLASLSQSYDAQAVLSSPSISYDLIAGSYSYTGFFGDNGSVKYTPNLPDSFWNPEGMAGSGVR